MICMPLAMASRTSGTVDRDYLAYDPEKAVPVADPEEVTEGPVQIVCTMNGDTTRYSADIRKID